MSRYADILKKSISQPQPVNSGNERVAVVDEKHTYREEQPPPKRGDRNYNRWEYAYFPHLVEMYRILCNNEFEWDPPPMYQFFEFIYYVSSGEISEYLEKPTEEQHEAYLEYQIKRNNL
jgi:hypothetical protein